MQALNLTIFEITAISFEVRIVNVLVFHIIRKLAQFGLSQCPVINK